jgi:hypothetical protein
MNHVSITIDSWYIHTSLSAVLEFYVTEDGDISCLICKAVNPRWGKPFTKKNLGPHTRSKQHVDAIQFQSQKLATSSGIDNNTSATEAQLSSIEVFPPVQTEPSTSQLPISRAIQDIYMEEESYFHPDGTEILFSAGESSTNMLRQNLALQLQHLEHIDHTLYAQEFQLPHDPEDSGIGNATESNVMQALYDMGMYSKKYTKIF